MNTGKGKRAIHIEDGEPLGVVIDLTEVKHEIREGYLHLYVENGGALPVTALHDLAVDMGTKTPDALVDRLVRAIQEHQVSEILAGKVVVQR